MYTTSQCVCGVMLGGGGLISHRVLVLVVCVPVEPFLIVFSYNVDHTLAEELDKKQKMQEQDFEQLTVNNLTMLLLC